MIDAQVHIWERESALHPWDPAYGRAEHEREMRARHSEHPFTADDLIAAMDTNGVAGALVVTPSLYGLDNRYTVESTTRHSGRLAGIGRIDPSLPDIDEIMGKWRSVHGLVGIRVTLMSPHAMATAHTGTLDRLLNAAQRHGVPLCIYCPGLLTAFEVLVTRFPDLQFVVDHLGLHQPPLLKADVPPLLRFSQLLALARFPNVAIKITGAPTLSGEQFPFRDLWPPMNRLIAAFGVDRVMWGSDLTRVAPLYSYSEAVGFGRELDGLSITERDAIMRGTLSAIFKWNPSNPESAYRPE